MTVFELLSKLLDFISEEPFWRVISLLALVLLISGIVHSAWTVFF